MNEKTISTLEELRTKLNHCTKYVNDINKEDMPDIFIKLSEVNQVIDFRIVNLREEGKE